MGGGDNPDVIVVGGGPAGLAAALACRERGFNCVVLERGADLRARRRADPADIASGVGGAGLFSDGKFSFYPSATQLWKLEPEGDLHEAYRRVCEMVRDHGVVTPPFPNQQALDDHNSYNGPFESKNYESKYMSLESRYGLVESFRSSLSESIRTDCSVTNVRIARNNPVTVDVLDRQLSDDVKQYALSAHTMIVANGRLGPMLLQRLLPNNQLMFRRLEVGFRIEQPAAGFFLRNAQTLDPKRIWRRSDGMCEWRTFCCCREGEVVPVLGDGILSVSGRSDVAPTGQSNVGFHVRVCQIASNGDPCFASNNDPFR